MKKILLIVSFVVVPYFVFSQNVQQSGKKVKKNYVSSEYDRSSLSIMGINFKEKHSNELYSVLKKVKVPEKFYDNPIKDNVFVLKKSREKVVNSISKQINKKRIARWLNKRKVGQEILSDWFNQQPDGTFNINVLKERGLYNATDNDFHTAMSSKRGIASLMDMGMNLIDNSYILLFDFYNLQTMNDYYEKEKTPNEDRTENGYKANFVCYLYKLQFNDSVAAVFFENYWTTNPNDKEKMAAFEKTDFPFKFLSVAYGQSEAKQYNPGKSYSPEKQKTKEELLLKLLEDARDKAIEKVENRNTTLRVKAMVSGVHPVASKIGKKEGLKFDQRYYVFENRQKRDGTTYSKRVAVVKSMKVADNRKITDGKSKSSHFYQIAGGKIDNYGMFLEQRNDAGFNIALGYTKGGLPGTNIRLEYYMSKVLGSLLKPDKSYKFLTSLKLHLDCGFNNAKYTSEDEDINMSFLHVGLGIAKDFYPLHFLHWSPFVAYVSETGTIEGFDNKVTSDFIEYGVRTGINITHNMQLMLSVKDLSMLNSKVIDANKKVVNDQFDYKGAFQDRLSIAYDFGIRIMF